MNNVAHGLTGFATELAHAWAPILVPVAVVAIVAVIYTLAWILALALARAAAESPDFNAWEQEVSP